MPHDYPLMLDVTARRIVIVGGGAVAARKAAGLIGCGATRVRAVAPAFVGALPAEVERLAKRYEASDLDDAELVFAATDSADVNDAVVRDAHARRIWASHAGDGPAGDFVTPAKFTRGPVTVTVSAGSAALAVLVRDGLEQRFDPAWSAMAEAMVSLRPMARDSGLSVAQRRDLFRELATDAACNVLIAYGIDGLRSWLRERYPQMIKP